LTASEAASSRPSCSFQDSSVAQTPRLASPVIRQESRTRADCYLRHWQERLCCWMLFWWEPSASAGGAGLQSSEKSSSRWNGL